VTDPNLTTRARILDQLKVGPQTAREIAQCCGHLEEHGVSSALNAMAKRGEAARLKAGPGEPVRFRLKVKAMQFGGGR